MALLKPCALHLVLVICLSFATKAAVLEFKSLPSQCFAETADKMCHKFFPKAVQDCLEVAEASDYIINRKKVCFVGFLNRCLPIDFCPEAMENNLTKLTKTGDENIKEALPPKPDLGRGDEHGEQQPDLNTQDAYNLLSSIGQYVFWTQLGIGIFLTVCLAISSGLLMWYRSTIKRLQSSNQDDKEGHHPEDPQVDNNDEPRSNPPVEPSMNPPVEPKPLTTADLNEAWNHADSQTPKNDSNPFTGWDSISTFRPLGPPQAVSEMIPMIKRPVAYTDKSTMTTETQRALSTLERNAIQSKQGARARWTESTEELNRVQEQLLSATLSHLEQAGYYTRHHGQLPPQTPVRTSSLRGSRRNRRARQEQRNIHRSDELIQNEQQFA